MPIHGDCGLGTLRLTTDSHIESGSAKLADDLNFVPVAGQMRLDAEAIFVPLKPK